MGKKYYSYFLLLIVGMLLVTSCSKVQNANSSDLNQTIDGDEVETLDEPGLIISIKDTIHPTLTEMLFKIYGNENEYTSSANKIVIYQSEAEQELHFEDTDTSDQENLGFIVEDMDFDGYKDIRIQRSQPAGPNIPYYYWLWDEVSSKYVANGNLEMITSPVFDAKNEWIQSTVRENATTNYEDIYKYIDEVPVLVKETEEIIDEVNNVVHITEMEFSYNEMKITKQYDMALSQYNK
ncbi:hypothetical protein PNBC_04215 [Paenibacillus crassostreae]|uniref:Lipoprotein n=2 Tax=Paenibacillus crassostreae TaxID=1763538 RepID=A0A167FJ42_9BACL|nr:hypothetical protein LPB68_20525 [Paenibacillus crassostreae]OAB76611.1 hypothetical protein PNBC_04215 [Paenibacillus crassostreae]